MAEKREARRFRSYVSPEAFEDRLCVLRRRLFEMRDAEGGSFTDTQRGRIVDVVMGVLDACRDSEGRAWLLARGAS
jgi:hypothetical protein